MGKNKGPLVILIDTNAMVALSLYVESCEAAGLVIGSKPNNIKNTLGKRYILRRPHDPIKNGYKLFDHISSKQKKQEVIIYFSLLSEMELLHVFLDRKFDQKLTQQGIPFRIRIRKPFRTQVYKERLKEQNIEFDYPENKEELIKDVIKISKIITKYIALDSVDLYLYSLGIYLRADEIYTYDEEFRSIMNKVLTNSKWKTIRNNIQKDLIKFDESFKNEYKEKWKIKLPKGKP